jgi:hypothetical protein
VFQEFPKIARLNREVIVTEKIDGTNAQIFIRSTAEEPCDGPLLERVGDLCLYAGSRNRWLNIGADNFGFAGWVKANAVELSKLGPGRHFGEWWGSGIQRGYGLPKGEKRFSLFNVTRWRDAAPACCHVVPTLAAGHPHLAIPMAMEIIRRGSKAAPFLNPEGIVVFHTASRQMYKVTLENDDQPKSKVQP